MVVAAASNAVKRDICLGIAQKAVVAVAVLVVVPASNAVKMVTYLGTVRRVVVEAAVVAVHATSVVKKATCRGIVPTPAVEVADLAEV